MKKRFRRLRPVKAFRRTAKRAIKSVKQDMKDMTVRRVATEVLSLLLILQLAVLGANLLDSRRPILGLRLEGSVVGHLAASDFRSQTDAIIHEYESKKLTVKVADETSAITLRQLGVRTDKERVYAEVLAVGRDGNVFANLLDQSLALLGGRNVSIGNEKFNSELAKAYIATLDKKINIPPTNAAFVYENGKVILRPDEPGRVIDADAAVEALWRANPYVNPTIELPIKRTTAQVTWSMLEPLLPEVRAIVQKPLTIAAGQSQVTLPPQQLVELIVVKIIPDNKGTDKMTAQITFDEAKLNAIVGEVVKNAVFAPKPTIVSGDTVVQQGESGVGTADENPLSHVLTALLQRQTGAAMPDGAQIPLVAIEPPVVRQQTAPSTRTGTGLVRLTFDDGPGGYTDQILDILARYNVHASFYVVGRNVPGYAAQMQRKVREGHAVCNHSYSHANLAYLSAAGVQQELSSTQAAIQQTTGVTPSCFRPPYGAYNQTVRQVAANLGLSIDMWSVDPQDWASPGSSVIASRVLNGTHAGAVVLLHVLNRQTVTALPSIIEGIRAQGYTLE